MDKRVEQTIERSLGCRRSDIDFQTEAGQRKLLHCRLLHEAHAARSDPDSLRGHAHFCCIDSAHTDR